MICGIFTNPDGLGKPNDDHGKLVYKYGGGRVFVISYWNVFSTIHFVQECLKRFGEPGDTFFLIYRDKAKKEIAQESANSQTQPIQPAEDYRNPYSSMLIESKNIIFRGAPGTGKSFQPMT